MANAQAAAGVAGRYASALFDLALEMNALEAVEADLALFSEALTASNDLRRLTKSPVFSRDEQESAVAAVAEKLGVGALVKNFLGVLCANRRLFAIEGVIRAFAELAADHRGEVRAEAVTAQALDEERLARLKTEIEAAVGRAVRLETRVDENLLGGVIVKIGSRMIDNSLRTKLNAMKTAMKGA
ncbi:MAG: F0F1 ATP synthase subunit delta [Pseudomonadota bacterium]